VLRPEAAEESLVYEARARHDATQRAVRKILTPLASSRAVSLNEDVFHALNGAGNPVLDPVMIAFAVVGLFPLTFLWALPLWSKGRRADAIDFVVVLALAEISAFALKIALGVERPDGNVLAAPFDDRGGFAFPSGHATRAFVAATFLALRLRDWRWSAPLLAYATVMGLSRIYVGAHWPSDVIGGTALGVAWAFGFNRFTTIDAYGRSRDWMLHRLSRDAKPRE